MIINQHIGTYTSKQKIIANVHFISKYISDKSRKGMYPNICILFSIAIELIKNATINIIYSLGNRYMVVNLYKVTTTNILFDFKGQNDYMFSFTQNINKIDIDIMH